MILRMAKLSFSVTNSEVRVTIGIYLFGWGNVKNKTSLLERLGIQ